jgi:integrase
MKEGVGQDSNGQSDLPRIHRAAVFLKDSGNHGRDDITARAGLPTANACRKSSSAWDDLRYTFSTWADPAGEGIKALHAQLGHKYSRLMLDV